jgi:DNA mismatch repair protein MutH
MRVAPPRCAGELALRADALAGRSLGELACALGVPLPTDSRRGKGVAGQLCERALGASAGSHPVPDFAGLGVELKTVPLAPDGKPRESTFVCSIAALEIDKEEWPSSRVRRKLAHVLWVPIEAAPVPLARRRFGRARLWQPSPAEEELLRSDWEELAGLIAIGRMGELTAHRGRVLQVRPKAAHARVRAFAPGPDETTLETLPRGFYLRAAFTQRILEARP